MTRGRRAGAEPPRQINVRLPQAEAAMLFELATEMGVTVSKLAQSIVQHVLWDDAHSAGGTIEHPETGKKHKPKRTKEKA